MSRVYEPQKPTGFSRGLLTGNPMSEEKRDYETFRKLVLDLFDSNFLLEEAKAPRERFAKTQIAESIIKKHFEAGGDRKEAEKADAELLEAYQNQSN